MEAWRLGGLGGAEGADLAYEVVRPRPAPRRRSGHPSITDVAGSAPPPDPFVGGAVPDHLREHPSRTPDRGAPILRLTLRSPQSNRRRIPSDRTRWCTSPSSNVASRTRLVCSTDRIWCASPTGSVYIAERTTGPAAGSGVHHRTVRWHRRRHWCTSPNRLWCITDRRTGITEPIGVHRHRRSCTSPNGAPDSQPGMVCITDVDGVHPDRRVCIRSARARNVVESIACNAHSGSAIVRTPVRVTRGSTDGQSGPHARLVAGLRSPTRRLVILTRGIASAARGTTEGHSWVSGW